MQGSNRYNREQGKGVEEEEGWFDLAHKTAKITTSSRGQMSIYSIFKGWALCVCECTFRFFFFFFFQRKH